MGQLFWKELRSCRRQIVVGVLALALALFLMLITIIVTYNGYQQLIKRYFVKLPAGVVLVEPKTADSLLFNLLGRAVGKDNKISETLFKELAALPAVEAAWPRLEIKVPMVASGGGSIFGNNMQTDLFASGLPPELLAGDLPPEVIADLDKDDGPVPVIISPTLLEMYNTTVAPALGTLTLAPADLQGLTFSLTLGKSYMLGRKGPVGSERCTIAGASSLATTLGFTVSLKTAARWMRTYAPEEKIAYSGVYLKLKKGISGRSLQKELAPYGLELDRSSRQATELLGILIIIITVFGGSVLLLALLVISQVIGNIILRRRQVYAILRSVGASGAKISALIISQGLFIGLAGGILGLLAGGLLLFVYNNLFGAYNEWLKQLGLATLSLPGVVYLLILLVALLTSLAATLPLCRQSKFGDNHE